MGWDKNGTGMGKIGVKLESEMLIGAEGR